MTFGKATPILRIFDEAKAKEFYVAFLGFKVDWEHRFEPGPSPISPWLKSLGQSAKKGPEPTIW